MRKIDAQSRQLDATIAKLDKLEAAHNDEKRKAKKMTSRINRSLEFDSEEARARKRDRLEY